MSAKGKNILIIGMAGGLAQITANLLLDRHPNWNIVGIDSRDLMHVPSRKGLILTTMRYSRGNFENLFRSNKFDSVLHLGRLSHFSNSSDMIAKRVELSVTGTNLILELCLRTEVSKVIILSTFHVYGALADNPIFLKEEAPLRASIKHPELRDVVEMDQIAANWMWRHQAQLSTIVLRPCYILGEQVQNTMTKFLLSKMALRPIDYNPFFQFIHELDMAQILYRSLMHLSTGTYNVASDDFISLRDALDLVGTKGIPVPMVITSKLNEVLKLFRINVPAYLLDYLKYSCLISNEHLRKNLGDDLFKSSVQETLELIRPK